MLVEVPVGSASNWTELIVMESILEDKKSQAIFSTYSEPMCPTAPSKMPPPVTISYSVIFLVDLPTSSFCCLSVCKKI